MAKKPKETYDQALAKLELNPKQLKAFEDMIKVARDALDQMQKESKANTERETELRGEIRGYQDQLEEVESLKYRNQGLVDFLQDIGLDERQVLAMSLGARNTIRDAIHSLNVKLYYKD